MADNAKEIWNYLVDNNIGFSKKVNGKWVPVDGAATEKIIESILIRLGMEVK